MQSYKDKKKEMRKFRGNGDVSHFVWEILIPAPIYFTLQTYNHKEVDKERKITKLKV